MSDVTAQPFFQERAAPAYLDKCSFILSLSDYFLFVFSCYTWSVIMAGRHML